MSKVCSRISGHDHQAWHAIGLIYLLSRLNTFKVTGYNFNFARTIINLYTKHWAVSAENVGISFCGVKTLCDRIYGLF